MISINATLIIQIINLLVLIFILHKIMYQPIRKIMARRKQEIEQGQAEVERLEQESQDRLQAYENGIRQGRSEVRQRLAELRLEAETQAKQVIAQAQEEAKEREAGINAEIEEQIQKARQEIRGQAQTVALSMARTLLGREVS
ncbi:MAG: ATP synthase F0 subunit B [Desulfarculaceae bacterium]|jgi:F-type H+-transporting ATPase subunit b